MKHPHKDERKLTAHISRWIAAAACLLVIVASCVREAREPAINEKPDLPITPARQNDRLTIFLTGNELGALKPCGCSGGQLGGLDRRPAVFSRAPKKSRLVIDTGSLVASESEQDLIKFNILNRAFKLLDYDVVNLSEEDLQTARNFALLAEPAVAFVSSYGRENEQVGRTFTKRYELQGKPVNVIVAPFDPEKMPLRDVPGLFQPESNGFSLNILILNSRDGETLDAVKEALPLLDCVVCPAEGDEPHLMSEPGESPMVFSAGRYGKHICELHATHSAEDNPARLQLSFRIVHVTEDLPEDELLASLYKDYQKIVRGSGLLEKHPRFNLKDDLKYVGSKACNICHDHEEECDKWETTRHADAYATLERVGSEADPECVGCHVIGFDYDKGFVTKEKTPKLKDVGCENCHGPGSKHVSSAGAEAPGEPTSTCEDCHTPDHSGEYAANKEKYLEKIIHW